MTNRIMIILDENAIKLQDLLERVEKDRKEASLSGDIRQYAQHLANENYVLRRIISAATLDSTIPEASNENHGLPSFSRTG